MAVIHLLMKMLAAIQISKRKNRHYYYHLYLWIRAVKQQKRGGLWRPNRNESCARPERLALHQLQTHLWSVLPVPDHSVPTLGLLAISELIVSNLLVVKFVLSSSSSLAMEEQQHPRVTVLSAVSADEGFNTRTEWLSF